MTERFLTEEARQGSWQVLCGICCGPDCSMLCFANIEQARNVRVIILARIRPQESNKLGELGRGQIIARAMQGSNFEGQRGSFCLFAAAALPFERLPGGNAESKAGDFLLYL